MSYLTLYMACPFNDHPVTTCVIQSVNLSYLSSNGKNYGQVHPMVATGQEVVRKKNKFFKDREISGNFMCSIGKVRKLK